MSGRPRGGSKSRRRRRPEMTFEWRRTAMLADGTVGYYMLQSRHDDCLRAALATMLQVSPPDVPDPRLDERTQAGDDPDVVVAESWTALEQWLSGRGQILSCHDEPLFICNSDPKWKRWIGVCSGGDGADALTTVEAVLATGLVNRAARRGSVIEQVLNDPTRVRYSEHCLVMSYDELLFDPGSTIEPPPGFAPRVWDTSEISWGITIEPKEGV